MEPAAEVGKTWIQYGALGATCLFLATLLIFAWRKREELAKEMAVLWGERLKDSKALETLVNTANTSLKALTVSVHKRANMTEALAETQRATSHAIGELNGSMRELITRLETSDSNHRALARDVAEIAARLRDR